MLKRHYATMLLLLLCAVCHAQETKIITESDTTTTISAAAGAYSSYDLQQNYYSSYPAISPYSQNQSFEVSPYAFDASKVMPRLGSLSGYVTQTSLPGLMGIESGSLSYGIDVGNFSFTPSVYVNKYGYFGGLTTSIGLGGEFSYRANDQFSFTAFGEYLTNSWNPNPAIMANMRSSRFGGYGTWNINDKWAMSVGAQRVYNASTGQWQTIPIAMPMFKINGKTAIGLDLGGILYEVYQVINSKNNNGWQDPMNPTIAPPTAAPQPPRPPRK